MNTADPTSEREPDGKLLKCEEIQSVLLEYMTRELGTARSALVREHLRRCPACQKEAAEVRATLDALRVPPPGGPIDEHLSEDRRRRLARAYMHPVLDWCYSHHILISVIAAIVVLTAVFCVLREKRLWSVGPPELGLTVNIGNGEPPEPPTNNAARGYTIPE